MKTTKRKPMGYAVGAMRTEGTNGASGTVWNSAKSLRQAMQWGKRHMAKNPEHFFTLTPIWGPVA